VTESSPTIAGACVCGAVTFTITPPFLAFQYCHCSRCRKASGSAHAANLFVRTAQLAWQSGESLVRRYDLPEAKYWSHCFCDTCGSAVPWLSRTGKAYIVPAGTLDDDPGMRPTRNIHFGSRAPWFVHASELETHDAEPPR
jgi:hypothetical protein